MVSSKYITPYTKKGRILWGQYTCPIIIPEYPKRKQNKPEWYFLLFYLDLWHTFRHLNTVNTTLFWRLSTVRIQRTMNSLIQVRRWSSVEPFYFRTVQVSNNNSFKSQTKKPWGGTSSSPTSYFSHILEQIFLIVTFWLCRESYLDYKYRHYSSVVSKMIRIYTNRCTVLLYMYILHVGDHLASSRYSPTSSSSVCE